MRSWDNWNRYQDNQNHPLHGCIQFMVKDGNTVAPIYDADGVNLPNPIITDVYGRTQHQVFVTEDVRAYFYLYIGDGSWASEQDIDTSDITKWSLQYTSESIDSSTVNINATAAYAVNSIADLRALDPASIPAFDGHTVITLLGYNEAGDKEPINYVWDPTATTADDGGSVIAGTELTGRWIMVQPTEHLDVRHFGVFPSNSQNMTDQTIQIQRACIYANNHGIRMFFDMVNGTQTYRYYKLSNITLTPIQTIDVAKGVYFIDSDVTIRSSSTHAFNNDPYFLNASTNLYSNYAKSSWNIKTLNKAQANVEGTYIIDDASKSTAITTLQGWNVNVNANITGFTFHLCNITGLGMIANSTITSCLLDVVGTLNAGNTFNACRLTKQMFNGTPAVAAIHGCFLDVADFYEYLPFWTYLNWMQDTITLDFNNMPVTQDMAINYTNKSADWVISNFIGNGQHMFYEAGVTHLYTFNNCKGNITLHANWDDNVYIFNNCDVNITVHTANRPITIQCNGGNVNFTQDLPNAVIIGRSSNVGLQNNYKELSFRDSTFAGPYDSSIVTCDGFTSYNSIIMEAVRAKNMVVKDSQINKKLTSIVNSDHQLTFFLDNNIFNAQHELNTDNEVSVIVAAGTWTNNTASVADPIILTAGLSPSDASHHYVYENNTGTFLPKKVKQMFECHNTYTIYGDVWHEYYLNAPELFTVPHLVYRGDAFPILDGSNRARYAYGVFIPQLWQPSCAFFSIGSALKRAKLTVHVPFSGNVSPLNGTSFSPVAAWNYAYSAEKIITANGAGHVLTEFNGQMLAGPQYIPYSYDLPKDVPYGSSTIPPADANSSYFMIEIEIS